MLFNTFTRGCFLALTVTVLRNRCWAWLRVEQRMLTVMNIILIKPELKFMRQDTKDRLKREGLMDQGQSLPDIGLSPVNDERDLNFT